MHTLFDLKQLFLEYRIHIQEYMGWYLISNGDRWTLLHDVFFLNGEPISKKEIIAYAKYNKPPARESKKIHPNKGLEDLNVDENTVISGG